MKKTLMVCLVAAVMGTGTSSAQGIFQNLEFEAAELIFLFGNVIATTNALPNWNTYAWNGHLPSVTYNSGGGLVFNPVQLMGMGNGEISGNFSVLLSSGYSGSDSAGSITQTGLVPADAKTLLFKSRMTVSGVAATDVLAVSMGGQTLPLTALLSDATYTVYGADISALAGQIQTLSLTAVIDRGVAMLDDIQFSSEPIPEPTVVALILLGSGILLCRRRAFR